MIRLDGQRLDLDTIEAVALRGEPVELGGLSLERMARSRAVVERIVETHEPVYGVNTGFGRLSEVRFEDPEELRSLQVNLVRSHACGLMEPLSITQVRAMMLLRANVLALGCSGARPLIAERLLQFLNSRVHPLVPSRGSVGASGDLAPLAHLALGLIGEGECLDGDGARVPAADVIRNAGLEPLSLEVKEGLALLNGTQAIGAVGGLALAKAKRVLGAATLAAAMTTDALLGTDAAFDARIHEARPLVGQGRVATKLREHLAGSEIRDSHREGDFRVQDAYSLRCIPQVHGAVLDALDYAAEKFEIESASATDNPLVFENGDVVSGGNFHGAPLAHAIDFAKLALVDLISICERRIDRLINPDLNEHLPAFLARRPGLESGLMITHVAVASLLAECRTLATPASVDNVPTSGGKEDHVSMGMTCALQFDQVVEMASRAVAVELIAASEGLRLRQPLEPSAACRDAVVRVRNYSPELDGDRVLSAEIEGLAAAVSGGEIAQPIG